MRAASRSPGWIIDWAQQPVLPLDIDKRVTLVPDMVARGHHIGSGVQHILQDGFGNPEAGGGVFTGSRYKDLQIQMYGE